MNEKKTKRREWVKTAAIIFLTVMLILTFFSQTIMNYSLPEVATQYVQSGSITAKVRGSGAVESGDPYNIMVKETRKVASVAVKTGQKVEKGDVLLYLSDEESTELEAAKENLDTAQKAYDMALISAEISAGTIAEAQSNTSVGTYRQVITKLQEELKKAKDEKKKASDKVDDIQKKYDVVSSQAEGVTSEKVDVSKEEKALADAAKVKENTAFALTEAENTVKNLQDRYNLERTVSGNDAVADTLATQLEAAKRTLIDIEAQDAAAQLAYAKAQAALNNKLATAGDKSSELKEQQSQLRVELTQATSELAAKNKALDEKQAELDAYIADINAALNLDTLYEAVTKASAEVQKQQDKAIGATVEAEIAGTVTEINAVAGKEVSAAEPVVVLQPENQGYTMSFSVTNEQARAMNPGDKASLVNSWYYNDINVTLASIKPDRQDPSKKKVLTFDVDGDVTVGQNLSVSVGQRNANYDLIVPNSAIREDNNGKFILTVESKSSPLGNRYIATRVDVQVIATDDTQSAITGALYGWEFVITTSTKPVEAGKQVRLSDQ